MWKFARAAMISLILICGFFTNLNPAMAEYNFLKWLDYGTDTDSTDFTVTVTNKTPNVPTFVAPPEAGYISDNTLELSVLYSDDDASDVGTTEYRIARSAYGCTNNTTVTANGTGSSNITSTNSENTTWSPGGSIGADDTYYWCARNNDGIASSAWTTGTGAGWTFVLETVEPTTSAAVTSGTLNGSWYTSQPEVTITPADATSEVDITYYCIDTDGGDDCTPTNVYSSALDILTEGTRYVRYYSTDNAGNIQTTRSLTVKYDTSEPTTTVDITNGTYTAESFNTTTTINGTASDDVGSGVASVQITIQRSGDNYYWYAGNWVDSEKWLNTTGTTTWTYANSIGTSNLTAGTTYTITAKATDLVGKTTSSGYGSDSFIFVTNTAPNFPTLISPASGSYTNDNTPQLSANYSDGNADDVGTTEYRISTTDAADCLSNSNIANNGTGSSSTTSSNTLEATTWIPGDSIGADGTYYWCARNNDGALTSDWTSMGSLTIDIADPVITDISIASDNSTYFYELDTDLAGDDDKIYFNSLAGEGANQTITLTITSTETNPDSASGDNAFGDTPTDSDDETTHTLSYTIEADAVTFNDLTATLTDKATNTGTYDVDFIQDNVDPAEGLVTSNNGYETDTSLTVAIVSFTDAASGMSTTDSDYTLEYDSATLSGGACEAFSGSWTDTGVSEISGNTIYDFTSAVSGYCYKFRYTVKDKVGNVTTTTSTSVTKVDTVAPDPQFGSIIYTDNFETDYTYESDNTIVVTVDRGSDEASGMSATNSDYILEYRNKTLSAGSCTGEWSAWTDANVDEVATATSYNFTSTHAKCYEFRYTVEDAAGNVTIYTPEAAHVIRVDNTAPTGPSLSYADGYYTTTSQDITFSATDLESSIATYTLYYKQGTLNDGSCSGYGDWNELHSQATSPYADNALSGGYCYTYRLDVTNNANSTTTKDDNTEVTKVDESPPDSLDYSFSEDVDNYNTVASQTITFSANETESGLDFYTLYYKQGDLSEGNCSDYDADWQSLGAQTSPYTHDNLTSGKCYIHRFEATNNAGLTSLLEEGDASDLETKVDTTPPSGGYVYYTDGYETDSVATVNYAAGTDAETGMLGYDYVLEYDSATLADGICESFSDTWIAVSNEFDMGGTYDVPSISGNCYKFRYTVSDNAANSTTYTYPSAIVKVDAEAPTTTAEVPVGTDGDNGWYISDVIITLLPVDTGAGLAASNSTLYCYDADNTCSLTTDYGSQPFTIDNDGVWYVWYRSVDRYGNVQDPQSLQIKVDTTAPTFDPSCTVAEGTNPEYQYQTGTTLYYNSGFAGDFSITAPAVDAESGIEKVNFPSLDIGFSGGGDDTSSQYSTAYTWATNATTEPGAQVATATANSSLTNTCGFTITKDVTAPSGGSISYNTGYINDLSINPSMTVDDGSDSGSGTDVSTRTLERAIGDLSEENCSDYGSFIETSKGGTYPDITDTATPLTNNKCYKYRWKVSDNVSNQVIYTTENEFKVDTSVPSVSIAGVAELSAYIHYSSSTLYYNNVPATPGSFTVNVSAADSESGVASVAGSTEFGDSPFADTVSPYTIAYSVEQNVTCSDPITATATSNADKSSAATLTCTLDTTAPTTDVSVTAGTLGDNSWYTTDATVTIVPADAASGVGLTVYCTNTINECDPDTPYTTPITISNEGTNYVRYRSTDNVGNVQDIQYFQIKVDTAAPINGSTIHTDGYQVGTTIAVATTSFTDAVSSMSATDDDYVLEYDSAPLTSGSCGSYVGWADAGVDETATGTSYNFTAITANCYKFRYTVKDKAGNTTTFTSSNITKIDTTIPDIVAATAGASDANRDTLTSSTWFKASDVGDDDQASFGWSDAASVSDDTYYYVVNSSADNSITTSGDLFVKTIGSSYNDYGMSVVQTSDGGYIIISYIKYSRANRDIILTKTDSSGVEQWTKKIGGSYNDSGYSVVQTSDGGYIVTGYSYSYGGSDYDIILIKTDSSGVEQWTKTIGGSNSDYGMSVVQTSDGGYIVTGYSTSYGGSDRDIILIKTDSSGVEQWTKTIGGSYDDSGYSVVQTSDGGYIVTGSSYSYGGADNDIILIKTDSSGVEQWTKTIGGSNSDYGMSVVQTSDGGYIVTGYSTSYGGSNYYDIILIKTDSSGVEQWTKTISGPYNDYGMSVVQTSDGGYIVTGYFTSYDGSNYDIILIKTDSSGVEQWTKTIGGSYNDYGMSVVQTSDGGYIVTGSSASYGGSDYDIILIRLDENGECGGCFAVTDVTLTEDETLTEANETVKEANETVKEANETVTETNVTVTETTECSVAVPSSTTTSNFLDLFDLSEGTEYFHVRPFNGAGTWGTERSFAVKYDRTAPTVLTSTLTSPNGGEIWTGGDDPDDLYDNYNVYNITWTAADFTDATSGLSATPITLEYKIGVGAWIQIATDEANDGTYSWTTPDLTNALVKVRVTAVDNAGNTASDVSDQVFKLSRYNNWVALHIEEGNYQSGGMGAAAILPTDLKVRVGNGATAQETFAGADDVTVTFRIDSYPYVVRPTLPTATGQLLADGSFGATFGGTSEVKTVTTDANGYASVVFKLGDRSGKYTVGVGFPGVTTPLMENRIFTATEREVFKYIILNPTVGIDVDAKNNLNDSGSATLSVTTNAVSYKIRMNPQGRPTHRDDLSKIIGDWLSGKGLAWFNKAVDETYIGTSGEISSDTPPPAPGIPVEVFVCGGDTCQGTKQFPIHFRAGIDTTDVGGIYENNMTINSDGVVFEVGGV